MNRNMSDGRRKRAGGETVYDKSLPLKGKPELLCGALCDIVRRHLSSGVNSAGTNASVQLVPDVMSRRKMAACVTGLVEWIAQSDLITDVNLSTFAFLFSEMVQYNHGRVTSLTQLHEKLADLGHHVGFRMIDVLCLREKTPKRETRLVNMLWYIQKTLWKTLFGKEADRLEQATANEATYYLFEDEPLVSKFISVPKDQSSLNCAAFVAGIVEAFLNGTQFPCKVRAFTIKDQTTTAFEIKFEDLVITRDKLLDSLK